MDDEIKIISGENISQRKARGIIQESHEPKFKVEGKNTNLKDVKPIDDTLKDIMKNAVKSVEKIEKEEIQKSVENVSLDEIMMKFKIMQKKYPDLKIPKPKGHGQAELMRMRKLYKEELAKRMKKSLQMYKGVMIVCFGACQYIFQMVGIDMTGFLEMHVRNMTIYLTCLEEMGEESGGMGFMESYSPLTRLFIYMGINTLIFVLLKKALKLDDKTCVNMSSVDNVTAIGDVMQGNVPQGEMGGMGGLLNMFQGLMNNIVPPQNSQPQSKPKSEVKRKSKIDEPDLDFIAPKSQ